jgi:hypothetical protein
MEVSLFNKIKLVLGDDHEKVIEEEEVQSNDDSQIQSSTDYAHRH